MGDVDGLSSPGIQVTLGGPQNRVGPSPKGKQIKCATTRERNSEWVSNGGLIQRSGTSGEVGGPIWLSAQVQMCPIWKEQK